MEKPNAFIGRATKPTEKEVAAALGESFEIWQQLIERLSGLGVAGQEWNSVSAKYGWALKLKEKKRTIVYLGPCRGCFRVSFALGERAVAAMRESGLAKSVLQIIDDAPKYAEGRGVRLMVKNAKDLAAVEKLALAKMAH